MAIDLARPAGSCSYQEWNMDKKYYCWAAGHWRGESAERRSQINQTTVYEVENYWFSQSYTHRRNLVTRKEKQTKQREPSTIIEPARKPALHIAQTLDNAGRPKCPFVQLAINKKIKKKITAISWKKIKKTTYLLKKKSEEVQISSQNQVKNKKCHHVRRCLIFHAKASAEQTKDCHAREKMKKKKKMKVDTGPPEPHDQPLTLLRVSSLPC